MKTKTVPCCECGFRLSPRARECERCGAEQHTPSGARENGRETFRAKVREAAALNLQSGDGQ